MKKLIVNADDFGLTESVNTGIIRTFTDGILTSASIMANGESFDDAVRLSKENPLLGIGAHLVLVEESPVLSPSQVPSLISSSQKLYKNYKEFLKHLVFGNIAIVDVEKELRAQVEKILQAGIPIKHIDSHQHLHIFPPILKVVIRIANEFGVRWIRNSYDGVIPGAVGQIGLAFLAKRAKRAILRSNSNTTDYFYGTGFSGALTENDLFNTFPRLKDGVSELMCHPGIEDDHLTSRYGHWGSRWNREKEALLSAEVKSFISESEIQLTNFSQL